MKSKMTLAALAAVLCLSALAADDAVVAPQPVANRQSLVANRADAITIPQMMTYQGRLTDATGVPVPDGEYSITFKLYTQPSGGNPFWSETQKVTTRDGMFSVLLGSVTPITTGDGRPGTGDGRPGTGAAYLGMTVAGSEEMTPRLRIAGTYALPNEKTGANYVPPGGTDADDAWVRSSPADSVLYTIRRLGIARGGCGNVLYGNWTCSMTNLGSACTTGISGTPGLPLGNMAVLGGYGNRAWAPYTSVGGGRNNKAGNDAADTSAIVVGGYGNMATAKFSAVISGRSNTAADSFASVGGGYANAATGAFATVGGGNGDTASDYHATVGGGHGNVASGQNATISGGALNEASGTCAIVGGGQYNEASGTIATVGGGNGNTAGEYVATVGGGALNDATGQYSTIGGGSSNEAAGNSSTVGGGSSNVAAARGTTVGGGSANEALGIHAFVGGGVGNFAGDTTIDTAAVVAGGDGNAAIAKFSTVAGGTGDTASSTCATVGGGHQNTASGGYSAVTGGELNVASGNFAAVGGGMSNTASNTSAGVGGGYGNNASGLRAVVGGGYTNTASGSHSVVPGGNDCSAVADYSFAVGSGSTVSSGHSGSAAFNGQTTTASGQTRVGALSKASGTFTIDHPLDPSGKILNHYFIEGPEMLNIYRGEVVLSAAGRAAVELPAYFDALNRNPMVQLTGVGSADVVYLAEKVNGNHFVIGGRPGMEVYWQVSAERKDPSAEITRIIMPVEQLKTGALAGHSLDDDFLRSTRDQLDRMGAGSKFDFRTAEGRQKYEEMKRPPEKCEDVR